METELGGLCLPEQQRSQGGARLVIMELGALELGP